MKAAGFGAYASIVLHKEVGQTGMLFDACRPHRIASAPRISDSYRGVAQVVADYLVSSIGSNVTSYRVRKAFQAAHLALS